MAYDKQTWESGDTITAAKLNHMEDGIGNSMQYPENAYFVNLTYDADSDNYVPDKTFSEIVEAYNNAHYIFGNFRLYIPDVVDATTTVYLEPIYNGGLTEILYFVHTDMVYLDDLTGEIRANVYSIEEVDEETVGLTFGRVLKTYPSAPASNGTYVFKATRTNNGITYGWVAE